MSEKPDWMDMFDKTSSETEESKTEETETEETETENAQPQLIINLPEDEFFKFLYGEL